MTRKKISKKGIALKKPVKISTKLAAVIGKGPMPRTDVTKKIWAYIKRKNLQSPVHGHLIKLDEKLKTILKPSRGYVEKKDARTGRKKKIAIPAGHIIMFDMTKQLSNHIESKSVKVNPSKASSYDYDEEDYDDDLDYASNPDEDYDDEYEEYEEDEEDEEDEDEDEDDY